MYDQQGLILHRLARLTHSRAILGEPDILSITTIKTTSSFFSKDKKQQQTCQNFINGLIFPTTAHLSSFISNKYYPKDPKSSIKAKLCIFDAFQQRDVHIQVKIPGSLEIQVFNMMGQLLPLTSDDYERSYFSSFLRSLYPMSYPNIVLYPLINRVQILSNIVKKFVNFSFKYELRFLEYEFQHNRTQAISNEQCQNEVSFNAGLQLLINFCLENQFFTLLDIVLEELKKGRHTLRYYELELQKKLKLKKNKEVIARTAQKLILHGSVNKLKQYQIEALSAERKFNEILIIGKNLFESGGMTYKCSNLVLNSYLQINQDKKFLKWLNLFTHLHNQNQTDLKSACYHTYTGDPLKICPAIKKSSDYLSSYSQLCFKFDNNFFNHLSEYIQQKKIINKNSKQTFSNNLINKIDQSLAQNYPFYEALILFEKNRGWKNAIKCRSQTFWLENDFRLYEEALKGKSSSTKENISFFIEELAQEQTQEQQNTNYDPEQQSGSQNRRYKGEIEQSFDGDLSEHEEEQVVDLPKCSKRVYTKRKQFNPKPQNQNPKKLENKILCNPSLQKLFTLLYNDIKLQASLDNWQDKIKVNNIENLSKPKKEIIAIMFLKKGFLHKKLMRNKKCQQALKMARKLSDRPGINLVATYQLILLYISNKNVKGVQFYLIELIKILKFVGIQSYDIVPQWAKPIMVFVIETQGIQIVKNIKGLFKSLISLYLRSNYSEDQISKIGVKAKTPMKLIRQ